MSDFDRYTDGQLTQLHVTHAELAVAHYNAAIAAVGTPRYPVALAAGIEQEELALAISAELTARRGARNG